MEWMTVKETSGLWGISERRVHMLCDNGIVTNSNKLTADNIEKIIAAYPSRESVDYFAHLVPNSEIADQNYNLSVSTYVAQQDKREVVDIDALNTKIARIVAREDVLRREIDRIIADIEGGLK
jgi:type I restriction enzyme M protein